MPCAYCPLQIGETCRISVAGICAHCNHQWSVDEVCCYLGHRIDQVKGYKAHLFLPTNSYYCPECELLVQNISIDCEDEGYILGLVNSGVEVENGTPTKRA